MAATAWAIGLPGRAISFDFVCQSDPTCASFDANALVGFQQAANLWTGLFRDPITVKIEIGFQSLGPSTLGGADVALNIGDYVSYQALLGQDRTSGADDLAFASIPAGSSFSLLINRTADSPSGAGSVTPYVDSDGDANNSTVSLATANLKALGGSPAYARSNTSGLDGWISFNSGFNWDFDRSNGISSGFFDFVGVAAHEIGHVLGFLSGVDVLDGNSTAPTFFNDNLFTSVSPLDLYRYSTDSKALGVIDWTADPRAKYFSIDGGNTNLGLFSTGVTHGDGRQASHWKDNLGLGLLDPTIAAGEQGVITALDVLAFDVIGYDRRDLTVQVPAPLPLAGVLAAFGWARRLRRRLVDSNSNSN